jgi:hypothetical protein
MRSLFTILLPVLLDDCRQKKMWNLFRHFLWRKLKFVLYEDMKHSLQLTFTYYVYYLIIVLFFRWDDFLSAYIQDPQGAVLKICILVHVCILVPTVLMEQRMKLCCAALIFVTDVIEWFCQERANIYTGVWTYYIYLWICYSSINNCYRVSFILGCMNKTWSCIFYTFSSR